MLAALAQDGWSLVGDTADADVLVVNTCGFIDAAKAESMAAIRDAVRLKRKGRCHKVVVTGCLAQRYAAQIAEEIPGVDAVIGLGQTLKIPEYVRSTFRGERPVISSAPPPEWQEIGARLLTTPKWTTYLKIGEGCDHRCSFCAIPGIRGDWRSRPPHLLIDEVKMLVDQGLKEVILIGQDTTLYGKDWNRPANALPVLGEAGDNPLNGWSLPRLVRALGEIEGLKWQRIMYVHPGRVNQDLIDVFGEVGNLAPYIDMPIQHGDDGVLKRMMRAGNSDRYLEIIAGLRQKVQNISIRSTFLLGFPGETDEEYAKCRDFVGQAQMDHVGVFVYSEEDSTAAFQMENTVPRKIAEERASDLMSLQAEISASRLSGLVGSEMDALVESDLGGGRWLARTERDAPEVDGSMILHTRRAQIGELVRVTVTGSSIHDLTGQPVGEALIPLTVAV